MEAKGYGAAGGSLITELKKFVPDVTTYPVDYPVNLLPFTTLECP
jgi:hypothetical protein